MSGIRLRLLDLTNGALRSERLQRLSREDTRPWMKVVGCFLIFINTYGIASTYGAYQSFYQTSRLATYSSSTISWIGTVQIFLLGLVGVVAGPLFDTGHTRTVLSVGCGLVVFGYLMLSLSRSYVEILLSQGVCIGIGQGLTYVPAVAAVADSFTEKRPIALGVAATGSAVGGVLLPIMLDELIHDLNFDWVNRVFALLTLAVSITAIGLLGGKNTNARRGFSRHLLLDKSAIREPPFVLLCLGLFLVELGYWIPPFTIPIYAAVKVRDASNVNVYILAIMNAGGFAGRILPAYVAQFRRIGPAWVLVSGAFSLGALILSWMAVESKTGLIIWAILVGFMSGITVSIPNAVLPRLSPSNVLGARSGMMWSFVSLAALIGAPIAGVLVNTKTSDFRRAQMFSGISICLGGFLLCMPAWHIAKKRDGSER